MELELQVHEVKRDPPAGCRGTWSTEQIQNILERSKQSQQGMLPNLETCLENAFWFLLSSFLGDSQIGTAFPACRGCHQRAWEAQSLQLRSHFVTSPVSLAEESSEALQPLLHLTRVLEKSSGFPVKFPKESQHGCSPMCKTTRLMGQEGWLSPTQGWQLSKRSLPSTAGDSSSTFLPDESARGTAPAQHGQELQCRKQNLCNTQTRAAQKSCLCFLQT